MLTLSSGWRTVRRVDFRDRMVRLQRTRTPVKSWRQLAGRGAQDLRSIDLEQMGQLGERSIRESDRCSSWEERIPPRW